MKAACMALLLASTAAPAASHRIAVIVGANRGALGRPDLHYSYRDAQDVGDTLVQVGEFKPADVHVLKDPSPETVLATLDRELATLRADGGDSLLVFYYSGHADGAALYPAGQPLLFAALRTRLESSAATVRLGIIDACNGGGWTGAKGLHAAPPFAVQVPLELAGEGSVLIASSSGSESAHESEVLLGSYFTHHLVAGLRGAADPRGDGVVTVTDAFAYAKERTIRDTAAVSSQPQHPSFFMNLRGRADLPLARVDSSPTLVELQEMDGPLQLIHLGTGVVVLEVPQGRRALKLSVPAGRYLVRRESQQGTRASEITVEPGRSIQVREEDLLLTGLAARTRKGGGQRPVDVWPLSVNDRPLTLSGGLAQVDLGLLLAVDNGPGTGDSSPALAPAIRYGLTDRVTLSFSAPGGICLGSSSCTRYTAAFGGDLAVGLLSAGPADFAATVGGGFGGGGVPLRGGLVARIQGGPVALVLTPQLRYRIRNGDRNLWTYSIGGQLVLQAIERLAFDVGTTLQASLATPDPFTYDLFENEGGIVPLTIGATFSLNRHFDARAQITFVNLLSRGTRGPGDAYTLGAVLSVRP